MAGELELILQSFEPPALPIHIVHREGHNGSRKIRAFVDLMTARLRADSALHGFAV
jgi:DNA-binding transcriptional LysR family regulator